MKLLQKYSGPIMGIGFGICMGVALDNIALGISIGVAFGAAFTLAYNQEKKECEAKNKEQAAKNK